MEIICIPLSVITTMAMTLYYQAFIWTKIDSEFGQQNQISNSSSYVTFSSNKIINIKLYLFDPVGSVHLTQL